MSRTQSIPLARRLGRWLEDVRLREHQLALVLSLVIGALVGLVVVAFILLTGRLAARMYPPGGAAWHRLFVPTLGAFVSGWLLFRDFPLARGSGIPQTKFALFLADGLITFRTVVGKFVCCSMSLASGIALGREGPSVHIGAGVASVLARRLGLSVDRVKSLVPVGCSAALAAAFNTPIAAVLFSLEEVMGDLHAPVLGSVVLSSATAWMVLHVFLGDDPLFHVAGYKLVHPSELAIYALLGIVGGLGSGAFVKLLLLLRRRFQALPAATTWIQPAIGGLAVGFLGFLVPEVLGVGYDYVERVLNGDVVLQMLVLLAVLKIVATAVSYASGNAGGIFGPSLFIGAMLGGAVGTIAHRLLPATTAEPGAYALVGMGTAFAGIIRTPLTSVIMIFELTRDYTIIVPLMISNLLAFYVSHRLQRVPIYEALALQDGIHLPTSESRGHFTTSRVEQVMRSVDRPFLSHMTVADALAQIDGTTLDAWPVLGDSGPIAMMTTADLRAAATSGMAERSVAEVREALHTDRATHVPHTHPDHSLALALERMGTSGHRVLPVVSRADVRQLVGVVSVADVLEGFNITPSTDAERRGTPPTAEPPDASGLVVTLAIVCVTVVALAGADWWLASKERTETRREATRLFGEGERLEQSGRHEDAIQRLRSALSLRRDEISYQLALARSLLAAGRDADAVRILDEVLRRQATDGEANLLMAHALVHQHRDADAPAYFHRAIYGRWPQDEDAQRLKARLELVDFFEHHGATAELLAELLPLEEAHTDERVQRRLARLFLQAGAPERSRDVWRRLQAAHASDAEAYTGVGEAELAMRNYRAAQASFSRALHITPGDTAIRARLALCDEVMQLDPTRRGLGSQARFERSVALLALARASLVRCSDGDLTESAGGAAGDELPMPTARDRETAIETNLQRAERLWQLRSERCKGPLSASEEALGMVLSKTSQ